jgi:disulfide bond formation protein DsbB
MNPVLLCISSVLVIFLLVIAGGVLLALLARAISRFLGSNMPSADTMAAFNTAQAAQWRSHWETRQSKTAMEKARNAQTTSDGDEDDEMDIDPGTDRVYNALGKYSRYVALLAAWVATCGSLYMSEVLGWVPCLLCWYQRILMYPLSIILAVGILRRDRRMHTYALPLSIPGAFLSLYHYLYQKTDLFAGTVPCTIGVPCSSDYLNAFGGVVTIPFLALIAFLIITFCMVASRLAASSEEEEVDGTENEAERPSRLRTALPVFVIIATVILAFVLAGMSFRSSAASTVPSSTQITTQPLPTPDSAALARGKVLYEESCASCHGLRGEGTPAGRALTNSTLVQNGSDQELAAFVRMGRSVQDAHNTTGLTMPASGGRADISDADLAGIIGYMRTLAEQAP